MRDAEASLRPTRAEVLLDAIGHNFRVVRRAAHGRKVLAVVKADAYGHGVVPVARKLQAEGVDGFGVALAEEGLELREAGIDRAILVLNGINGGAHRDIIAAGLTPVLYDLAEARAFQAVADGRPVDVHLKVDTGMGRLGVPVSELTEFLRSLRSCPAIRIAGLMTHLATADADPEYVAEQVAEFRRAEGYVRRFGHDPSVRHAANSPALFRHPETHFEWVRPGISIFGYAGSDSVDAELKPAMRWRTEVLRVRTLMPGQSVSYGRSFVARRETRLATIPLGYGDGLLRSLSNRGHVLIRGARCPIVGNIAMDLTTVDVSSVPDTKVGEEALLFGEQDGTVLDAAEVARAAGTIPYEVLTNVSRRVPRIYVGS